MHGCPVRYWGSRYGTDGLLTWLPLHGAAQDRCSPVVKRPLDEGFNLDVVLSDCAKTMENRIA